MCRITLPAYASSAYVPVLVMERAVFVRELSDGLYRHACQLFPTGWQQAGSRLLLFPVLASPLHTCCVLFGGAICWDPRLGLAGQEDCTGKGHVLGERLLGHSHRQF